MKQWIRKMYDSSVIRYIFFGRMYHYGKSGQLFHSQKAEGGAEYRQYYFDHPGDPVCLCGKFEVCFSRINARH